MTDIWIEATPELPEHRDRELAAGAAVGRIIKVSDTVYRKVYNRAGRLPAGGRHD